jgi:hypothetical protein
VAKVTLNLKEPVCCNVFAVFGLFKDMAIAKNTSGCGELLKHK